MATFGLVLYLMFFAPGKLEAVVGFVPSLCFVSYYYYYYLFIYYAEAARTMNIQ